MAARAETRRNALLAIAATLVGLVALNTVLGITVTWARMDLTRDALYSTSPGVRALLATLDEPVRVDLYSTPVVSTAFICSTTSKNPLSWESMRSACAGGSSRRARLAMRPMSVRVRDMTGCESV